jgi:hypothetical protein
MRGVDLRPLALLLGSLGLVATSITVAEPLRYRTGLPPVAEAAVATEAVNGFDRARWQRYYRDSGSPASVIYWNRQLADVAREIKVEEVRRGSVEAFHAHAVKGRRYGEVTGAAIEAEVEQSRHYVEGPEQGKQLQLDQSLERQLRDAFLQQLIADGVRLVDRTLSQRMVVTAGEESAQEIERKALTADGEWLIEVVLADDGPDPFGLTFHISVRSIGEKRLITTLNTDALPNPGEPGPFVASPEGGFERLQPAEPSAWEIGSELAVALMARLSGQ